MLNINATKKTTGMEKTITFDSKPVRANKRLKIKIKNSINSQQYFFLRSGIIFKRKP